MFLFSPDFDLFIFFLQLKGKPGQAGGILNLQQKETSTFHQHQ